MVSQSPQLADMPIGKIVNAASAKHAPAHSEAAKESASSFEAMLPTAPTPTPSDAEEASAATSQVKEASLLSSSPILDEEVDPATLEALANTLPISPEQAKTPDIVALPLVLQEAANPHKGTVEKTVQLEGNQADLELSPAPLANKITNGTNAQPDSAQPQPATLSGQVETNQSTRPPVNSQPVMTKQAENTDLPLAKGTGKEGQSLPSDQLSAQQIVTQSSKEVSIAQPDDLIEQTKPESQNSQTSVTYTDNGANQLTAGSGHAAQPFEAAKSEEKQELAGKNAFTPQSQEKPNLTTNQTSDELQLHTTEANASKADKNSQQARGGQHLVVQINDDNDSYRQVEQKAAVVTVANGHNIQQAPEDNAPANGADPIQQNAKQATLQTAETTSLAKQASKQAGGSGDANPNNESNLNNLNQGKASEPGQESENPLTKPQDRISKATNPALANEAKPAALHAPKGEAFSRLMAQIEPFAKAGDLMSQTDTSLRTDSFGQLPTETSTVRLTGMEQFTRTGQLPPQASLANSQALAAQISKFAKNGETRFEIRLDPAELGKIDVRLTIGSDGQTRAHLFVERSETLDYLMRDARGMERALQQSGIELERKGLEFSLMDQGNQNNNMASDQHNQNDDQSKSDREAFASNDNRPSDDSLSQHQQARTSEAYLATDGLNMII